MKVELVYDLEAYNTLEYKVSEKTIKDYIAWCGNEGYSIEDEESLIEYLQTYCDFDEDLNVKNSFLKYTNGLENVINKCLNLINEHRGSKTEISGDNPETK